jgi:hypothetical protein
MSDLTFDLTLSVLPWAGCAFATAFGAAVLALVGLAAAGLMAAFSAGAGFTVSAIRVTPFEQLGRKKLSCYPPIFVLRVPYSTIAPQNQF